MSKQYSNFSLGRNLPSYANLDPSRMGFGSNQPVGSFGLGPMGQGSNQAGMMGMGSNAMMGMGSMGSTAMMGMGSMGSTAMMGMGSTSIMGQQRSTGPSPQGLPSSFRLGSGGPSSSQTAKDSDQVSSLLASFGLSSSDLDELSRLPEDKITADNLPEIIQHLKKKRSENTEMLGDRDRLSHDSMRPPSDNRGDLRPSGRSSLDDRPSGFNSLSGFGPGVGSQELAYRERLAIELREQERLRNERMAFDSLQKRGMPSGRNVEDFHGLTPKAFPHLCSICDYAASSMQIWNEHINSLLHHKQRLVLLELYPQWKPNMGGVPFMGQQGSIPGLGFGAPGPMQMPMGGAVGGPNVYPADFRAPMGMEGKSGPKLKPNSQGYRVVHIVGLPKKPNLRQELMLLVEPFGTVTNDLLVMSKFEAFIEMSTPAAVTAIVQHFHTTPAYIYGTPVKVFQSQKYKTIQKKEPVKPSEQITQVPEQKTQQPKRQPEQRTQQPKQPEQKTQQPQQKTQQPEQQPEQKTQPAQQTPSQESEEGFGHVVRICNLPKGDYTDNAVVKLAKPFGKVKNHLVLRKMNQAFIEMEWADCARNMVARCSQTPLLFKGKALQVIPSHKYKTLVLRDAQEKKRKRDPPSESKSSNKKQRKAEGSKKMADIVKGDELDLDESFEAEEADEENFDGKTADATLGTGNKDDVPETDLDQSEPLCTTPGPAGKTTNGGLGDETGNENKSVGGRKAEEQPSDDMETDKSTAPAPEELEPYQPNVPFGVKYVIPQTGYYCKLCALFYTSEEMAKVTHCCSLAHYQKLKKTLSKPTSTE